MRKKKKKKNPVGFLIRDTSADFQNTPVQGCVAPMKSHGGHWPGGRRVEGEQEAEFQPQVHTGAECRTVSPHVFWAYFNGGGDCDPG